jgi:two-component system KDP operon response regulator KdpE
MYIREVTAMSDHRRGHAGAGSGEFEDPPPQATVLVVDDDPRTRKYLRGVLLDQELHVVEAATGADAIAKAGTENPDLVLLDLGLPDIDGTVVAVEIRRRTAAPILIVSARDEDREKIDVLDRGANDFITKPFGTAELIARIRVWLRQAQHGAASTLTSVLEVGPLRIDFDKRLAFAHGVEVPLTLTQFRLFAVLMRNAGKVMTHEQILAAVWGPKYSGEIAYLRVYMGRLRQKFEDEPANPRYFVTEPGVGYRLRVY